MMRLPLFIKLEFIKIYVQILINLNHKVVMHAFLNIRSGFFIYLIDLDFFLFGFMSCPFRWFISEGAQRKKKKTQQLKLH